MHVDVLVAEIGSTTTLLNAFSGLSTSSDCSGSASLDAPTFLGQGQAPTSVDRGDVCIGLDEAKADLARVLGCESIECGEFLATSSAAGGLRMTVHGLIYDMTVKAAMAAALGAGAVIRQTTAGKLNEFDWEELQDIDPKLIMLAGGTDYGEQATVLYNARFLAAHQIKVPVIYAGNVQCVKAVRQIFEKAQIPLFVTENVYPKLDLLNIEPARKVIQVAFEDNIVKAPGMEKIRERVNGTIMPTPGAVMECARALYEKIGDLVVFDVGGATTDVHSVSQGSEEIDLLAVAPEPFAKRTVEGDLGVYVNAPSLINALGEDALYNEIGHDFPLEQAIAKYLPIPQTPEQVTLTTCLCRHCALKALERHVGMLRHVYSPSGRRTIAEGKDLTLAKTLIATGGALTKLPTRADITDSLVNYNKTGMLLYPKPGSLKVCYDNHYIMASIGVLSRHYPQAVLPLMQDSFNNKKLT